MIHIGIIGGGPVGLATAEALLERFSGKEAKITLLECSVETRATFKAAAAFWTPFCTGTNEDVSAELSLDSLEYYLGVVNNPGYEPKDTGLVVRKLEMHFLENTIKNIPCWAMRRRLETQTRPNGDDYINHNINDNAFGTGRTRCEFSYKTPVICVDKFVPWLKSRLESIGLKVKQVDCAFSQASNKAWEQATQEQDILVWCMGAQTIETGITGPDYPHEGAYQPKKGVVAHIPKMPKPDDPVVLFEGGRFDSHTLYMVPTVDNFVLGGTVFSVDINAGDNAWTSTQDEIEGILSRAEIFLPGFYKEVVREYKERLESNPGMWRVGVRPMLSAGPIYRQSPKKLLGKQSFLHYGHGGSGFTFCHFTAKKIVALIDNYLVDSCA